VFSVGVLLWEALEGKPLSPLGTEPAGIRVRAGALPAPNAPGHSPWAKALVPVAMRALESNPEDRWSTGAAMAGEIRKAAGLKLAAASAASAFAKGAFGEHTKERRARWESASKALRAAPAASGPSVITAAGSVAPRSMRPRSVPAPASMSPVSSPLSSPFSSPLSAELVSTADLLPDTKTGSSASMSPRARSEEFSSSVLESFHPPPPPSSGVSSSAPTDIYTARVSAPAPAPSRSVAPIDFDSFAVPGAPASPEALSSADAPLPLEAPVVFDEAPTMPSQDMSLVAPVAPVFGDPAGDDRRRALRRKVAIGAGGGFAGLAAIVLAVHLAHPAPADPPVTQAPAEVAVAATVTAPPSPPPPAAVAAATPPSATPSPATPSSATPAPAKAAIPGPAKPRAGKGHVGPTHTKSSTVRGTHKPGAS
jgi:hypothetical protein